MNRQLSILFFSLFYSALMLSCTDINSGTNANKSIPQVVKTEVLEVFSSSVERHITGRLQAAQSTSLSFEVGGVVTHVYVNLGQAFTKGDALAQLDPTLYKLAVEQQNGLLGEATAAAFESKQSLDRNLQLKQQNLVSQAIVDNSQAAYNIAIERVNSSSSGLAIAKQNLAHTTLYAPYNGTLAARLIEPNQQINTQMAVFTIQGNANLEVTAVVPESIIGRVSFSQQVAVVIPALHDTRYNTKPKADAQRFKATLTEVGTQASIANAFPITITFNEHYPRLLPGMSAEVILPLSNIGELSTSRSPESGTHTPTAYQVPIVGLATDKNGQYVLIVVTQGEEYITQKQYINILQTLPSHVIATFDSWQESPQTDFEIIAAGVEFVTDAQHVTPLTKIQQIYNQ